jgi:PAS domain S-box-containing protein
MQIDPFTLTVLNIITSLLMSAGLFALSHSHLSEIKGIRHWAAALLLISIGSVLMSLSGKVADFFSMALGTSALILATAVYYHALVLFKDIQQPIRWAYICAVFGFIGNVYFVNIDFNLSAKISVNSLCVAVLLLASAKLLLKKQQGLYPVSHRLTAFFFTLCGCMYAIRAIYYLAWDVHTENVFFHINFIQSFSYLLIPITVMAISFGFSMMCIEKYLDEKNQAQAAEQELFARLQKIASHVPGVVYQFQMSADEKFSVPYCSDGIKSTFRLKPEQVRDDACQVFERIYPEDYQAFMLSVRESAKCLTLWEREFRIQFEDGTIRWLNGHAAPQRESDGSILWHGYVNDITERKQIEETLKANEAFINGVLDSLSSHIAVLNEEGVIIAVNHAWRQFADSNGLMQSCQYMIGQNYFTTCHNPAENESVAEIDLIQAEISKVLAGTSRSFSLEYPCDSPTERRWFFMQVLPLHGIRKGVVISHENITERKLAKLEAEQHEERFRLAFENANVGICLVDLKGNLIKVNDEMCRIFGYSKAELERMNVNDLSLPEYRDVSLNFIQQAEQGKTNHAVFEKQYLNKQGQIIYALISSSLVKNNEQQPLYFISHVLDITERKQTEQRLQEITARFEAFAKASRYGFGIADVQGNLVYANQALADLLGEKTVEACLGKNFISRYYPPKVQEKLTTQIFPALLEKGYWSGELEVLTVDGRTLLTEKSYALIYDSDGKPTYLTNILTDISERKRVENALKESELRHRIIIETAMDGFWLVNPRGHLLQVNQAYCDMSGYTAEELLTMRISDLEAVEKDERIFERVQKIIHTGKDRFESKHRRKDGSIFDVEVNITFQKTIDDAPFVVFLQDITERKQFELALQQAKERAERANQAKSEFLANMSHEIRTPMNAILGFGDILSDLIRDKTQLYYLNAIRTSGKTLLQLINDVLDLSKIEAGKLELDYKPVALKTILDDIRLIFMQKVTEKSLAFEVKIAPQIPPILLLDEIRLRQILLNLVGNAVKFTPHGFIRISIELSGFKNLTGLVDLTINVEDSGIGISQDQQECIFDSFTQQKNQSSHFGGTGLGLTISKRLIEMMGGTISVRSEQGEGSCFSLHLADVKICKNVILAQETQTQTAAPLQPFKPAKLLLVEDIEANRLLIQSYLQGFPELAIFEAETAQQALTLVTQQSFDLILMDKRLPDGDGDELCQKIKRLADYAAVPIIMITASAVQLPSEQMQTFYNVQLNKPVNKQELLAAMRQFLPEQDVQASHLAVEATAAKVSAVEHAGSVENQAELLTMLKNNYQRKINQLNQSGAFQVDLIIELADSLLVLNERYHYAPLQQWAETLKEQAELFDLNSLPKTLSGFNRLLE